MNNTDSDNGASLQPDCSAACESCRWFVADGPWMVWLVGPPDAGECRLYPHERRKLFSEWCSHYTPNDPRRGCDSNP